MRIPGAEHAVIDPFKIRNYLLSQAHEDGRHKAAFFAILGYHRANWLELNALLRLHAAAEHAQFTGVTPHGMKYTVVEYVTGPSKRSATIISVWIVRNGEHFPRLVTAYRGGIR